MSIVFNDRDVMLPFSFVKAQVRGKILRLNSVAEDLLHRFSTHPSLDKIFLETLALSEIIASNFKFEGTFKLQINCYNSILKGILCDANNNGEIRAYLSVDEQKFASKKNQAEISFKELCSEGYMIFHMYFVGAKHPYQGVVELKGDSVVQSALSWFHMSEQIKTYINIVPDVKNKAVFALFLQRIADQYATEEDQAEQNDLFSTLEILSNTLTFKEAFQDNFADIINKLYHQFDPLIYEKKQLIYKCSCDGEKIRELLESINKTEPKTDNSPVEIECSFCGKIYYI